MRTLLDGSQMARSYADVVGELGTIDGDVPRDGRPDPGQVLAAVRARTSRACCGTPSTGSSAGSTVEVNSTNDNPLFDVERGAVLSGGNFSGGHVALAMDALADRGRQRRRPARPPARARRRREVQPRPDAEPDRGHPAGDPEEGLNHGFKGMQIACSSLTAEALSRCMPMTVFSRSTECHNQDKVSMGATAARHTRDVVALTEKVAAIHLLALCQAADLRGADQLGRTRRLRAGPRPGTLRRHGPRDGRRRRRRPRPPARREADSGHHSVEPLTGHGLRAAEDRANRVALPGTSMVPITLSHRVHVPYWEMTNRGRGNRTVHDPMERDARLGEDDSQRVAM